MVDQRQKTVSLKTLHEDNSTFVLPNPEDAGLARVQEGHGLKTLTNTSTGFAHSHGKLGGKVTRERQIWNGRMMC